MKITKILILLTATFVLSGCQNSISKETENVKISGLINQDITYSFDQDVASIVFESPRLASFEIINQDITFHLRETGETKFKVNYLNSDYVEGILSIYDFSYSGERSTIMGVTTQMTVNNLTEGYTFTSSDESIAKISETGLITPLRTGECNISLSFDGATYTKPFYVLEETQTLNKFYIDGSPVNFFGRDDFKNQSVTFYNGASGFETKFVGTSLKGYLSGYYASFYGYSKMYVEIDGIEVSPLVLSNGTNKNEYTICSGLPNATHSVKVLKMGECGATDASLYSLSCDGYFLYANEKPSLKLEVYGDSITAGYGNMRGPLETDGTNSDIQNTLKTYECVAAKKLNAQVNVMARSGIGLQYAGAITGDYNMNTRYEYMYPQSNVKWNMHNFIPDVVVINLGTNDAWDVSKFNKENFISEYLRFVDKLVHWYGNQTKFIICCGLMHQGNPVLPILQKDIFPKLIERELEANYLLFNNSTSNGHPLENEHYEAGLLLADKISELII